MRSARLALFLGLLLVAPAFSGCLELEVARVPDKYLEGRGGNGWAKNQTQSQTEATSAQFGLVKTQFLVYEDRQSEAGYAGSLTIATLRTLLRPSESSLQEQVAERVRTESEGKGIRIDGDAVEGQRTHADGEESFYFVYNGTVAQSGFFARNARVKIIGEIWQCASEKTVVVAIGLAQITDTRTIGGVPLPSDEDRTTWREIVADSRGRIEGHRGSDGLIWNVEC